MTSSSFPRDSSCWHMWKWTFDPPFSETEESLNQEKAKTPHPLTPFLKWMEWMLWKRRRKRAARRRKAGLSTCRCSDTLLRQTDGVYVHLKTWGMRSCMQKMFMLYVSLYSLTCYVLLNYMGLSVRLVLRYNAIKETIRYIDIDVCRHKRLYLYSYRHTMDLYFVCVEFLWSDLMRSSMQGGDVSR